MSIQIPFPEMSKELEQAFNQVFKTVDDMAQKDQRLTGKTNFQMNVVIDSLCKSNSDQGNNRCEH